MKNSDFFSFAKQLCAQAKPIVQQYFRSPTLGIESKSDDSPVTIADRSIEALLRKEIEARYPQHGIIGEEYGSHNPTAEYVWVLDPIDGTKEFICGVPFFGVMIGVLHNQIPTYGAVYLPILDQLYLGDNYTATLNDKVIHAKSNPNLNQAIVAAGNVDILFSNDPRKDKFKNVASQAGTFRTWGGCFGTLQIAAGHFDVVICTASPGPWDIYPLMPIVKGSGAIMSQWNGSVSQPKKSAITATKALHLKIIEMLNG